MNEAGLVAVMDEIITDLKAALDLIEKRHPDSNWSFSKSAVQHPYGRGRGVHLFVRDQQTHETALTFAEAAGRACDRLDRRLIGESWA